MNSSSDKTIFRLKVLAKEKERARRKLAVTAQKKENVRGKLALIAREKETVRNKLVIVAREKESIKRKLEVTAEKLRLKADQLAVVAKEKENIRIKLNITAKEKETTRGKLAVTAKKLALIAKEKEAVRSKLVIVASEKESIRRKLEVTAEKLAVVAKEKEYTRGKLVVTAKQLAVIAKEKEGVRRKLLVTAEALKWKAENLAVAAKEKESIKRKLEVTAKQLAKTAIEKENVRHRLEVTAEKLAVTAKVIGSANKYARSLIEASLDPLVTISPEGKITDVNSATMKVTGVSRRELIGTDFSKYFTEPEKAFKGYTQVFKEGFVTDYPLTIRNQTGKLIDVLYNASVYKDDKGNVLGVFAAARDVTASKKAIELIESTNKELRLLDLAKDEFVSVASHQLRTPLTALKGYTGMLLDGDPGPINDKQREYLNEIKNANDRMIELITALLNVSRVDLGVFVVEPEPIHIEEVADSVLKELGNSIKYKKLRIITSFEKDLPPLNADLKIIRMIFQNLLSNAVKYTSEEGSITLNIKNDSSSFLISIADTGYGIPESAQSKIFTKLFRADNARVKDPNGTGLGLYIIKETIEKTGGKLWFTSKENQGSVFYVSIPLEGMKKKTGSKRLQ